MSQRIFDSQRDLGADGEKNAQILLAEGVAFGAIKRQYAQQTVDAIQRDSQRRAQRAVLGRIVQVTGFHRWIAVEKWFVVFRNPPRKALADGNLE